MYTSGWAQSYCNACSKRNEGKGVREMDQCTCKWPPEADEDNCFGLVTNSWTWYFYTTSTEGGKLLHILPMKTNKKAARQVLCKVKG